MSEIIHQKKPGETVFSFLMLVFSLFLLWQAYLISGFTALSSPGAFPLAASAIMVIGSCIAFVKSARQPSTTQFTFADFTQQILPVTVAVMIGIILIFAVVLQKLGFILTAFGFLFLTIKLLHKSNAIKTVMLSAFSLVLIYIVFRLVFKVVLPEGIVPEREIMSMIAHLFSAGGK